MADETRYLKVVATSDTSAAEAQMKRLEDAGTKAAKAPDLTSAINKSLPGVTSAISLVEQAYDKVEGSIKAVVTTAMEAQAGQAELAAVAANSADEVNRYADELSQKLKRDTGDFVALGVQIAKQTGAQGAELTGLMQLAVQISGITGKSLEAAAVAADKYVKHGGAIKGMALDLGGGATEAERLANAINATAPGMDALQAKLGGIRGPIEGIKTQWTELNVTIGKTITDSPEVIGLLQDVEEGLTRLEKADWSELSELVGTVAELGRTFSETANAIADMAEALTDDDPILGVALKRLDLFRLTMAGVHDGLVVVVAGIQAFRAAIAGDFDKLPQIWADAEKHTTAYRWALEDARTATKQMGGDTTAIDAKLAEINPKAAAFASHMGDAGDATAKVVTYTDELNARIDALGVKESVNNQLESKAEADHKKMLEEVEAMQARVDKQYEDRAALHKKYAEETWTEVGKLVELYDSLDAKGQAWLTDQFPLIADWKTQVSSMRDPVDKLRDALQGVVQTQQQVMDRLNAAVGGHTSIANVGGSVNAGPAPGNDSGSSNRGNYTPPAGAIRGSAGWLVPDPNGKYEASGIRYSPANAGGNGGGQSSPGGSAPAGQTGGATGMGDALAFFQSMLRHGLQVEIVADRSQRGAGMVA